MQHYEASDQDIYDERTTRNLGWITPEEQQFLRHSCVGIAGNGGMGGLIGAVLVRTGIGNVKICDCEGFDLSNLNRQYAARLDTIGKNKATETAAELRRICRDFSLTVDERGITEASVADFVQGCDLIFDEIEFFAVDARILLHEYARRAGVPIINCNTVGFGTRLFLFTPQSTSMEELLGFTYDDAREVVQNARAGSSEARELIIQRVMHGLVPELPTYAPGGHEVLYERLRQGKAPIIGTNPPMATGFAADRALLYLLRNSSVLRDIVALPEMPAYLYFDAALMQARVVTERWW